MYFLGGYLKPNAKYISKRIKGNFYKLIHEINMYFNCDLKYLEKIRTQINSYLGIFGHFKSYKLRQKILSNLENKFFEIFFIDDRLSKVSFIKNYA